MTKDDIVEIPARRGKAARVARGQIVRVINTHGDQVVDTWAFAADDLGEFMSMEHSRPHMLKLSPAIGDVLRTNLRRPILTLLADTAGGIHDTLMAACDSHRYKFLGVEEYHDNCTDNLHAAIAEIGLKASETPSPLNLFMNIPVQPDRSISFEAPVSAPGSYVALRAEMDLIVVFSACPQDILPINGVGHLPTEAHFSIGRGA